MIGTPELILEAKNLAELPECDPTGVARFIVLETGADEEVIERIANSWKKVNELLLDEELEAQEWTAIIKAWELSLPPWMGPNMFDQRNWGYETWACDAGERETSFGGALEDLPMNCIGLISIRTPGPYLSGPWRP